MAFIRRALTRSAHSADRDVRRKFKGRRIPGPWQRLILWQQVDLVLDVGGGVGQYAAGLREIGYSGRIVSFEPLSMARAELERRAAADPLWTVSPIALGEADGTMTLHVSGNRGSSSMLDMLDRHRSAAPVSAYTGDQQVAMRRLEGILDALLDGATRPFMKVDVQGYELSVLRGAGSRLGSFRALQLELSRVPLYAGGPLQDEVEGFMTAAGYTLAGVLQGFSDPVTGQMLQLDGLFVRRDLLA